MRRPRQISSMVSTARLPLPLHPFHLLAVLALGFGLDGLCSRQERRLSPDPFWDLVIAVAPPRAVGGLPVAAVAAFGEVVVLELRRLLRDLRLGGDVVLPHPFELLLQRRPFRRHEGTRLLALDLFGRS